MIKVKCECESCRGTGLYSGFMEAKDEAVVCVNCGGHGFQQYTVKEFTGRKKRRGIKRIRVGSGLIVDNTTKAKWFSYAEFERAIPSKGKK